MAETEGSTIKMGSTDWELLRKQKRSLVELRAGSVVTAEQEESLEGIINLIDYIQDQVVDSGQETEEAIFGEEVGS